MQVKFLADVVVQRQHHFLQEVAYIFASDHVSGFLHVFLTYTISSGIFAA